MLLLCCCGCGRITQREWAVPASGEKGRFFVECKPKRNRNAHRCRSHTFRLATEADLTRRGRGHFKRADYDERRQRRLAIRLKHRGRLPDWLRSMEAKLTNERAQQVGPDYTIIRRREARLRSREFGLLYR